MQNSIKQREIKVRAWDIEEKEFKYPKLIWDNTMPINWEQFFIIERYLNIEDKNKKPIYEGDILRYPDMGMVRVLTMRGRLLSDKEKESVYKIGEVCFFDGCTWVRNNGSMFCLAWEMTPKGNPHESHLTSQSLEIIGNIHQNPELL